MELRLDAHLITDVGLARERNEDRCGAFTPEDPETRAERGRLFVVADGMGGHVGGDIAAEMTVQSLPASYFQGDWRGPVETLRRAFVQANSSIEKRAASEPGRYGMGAAAVAAAVVGDRAIVAHLGDCRAYLVRGGEAQRLTADHSWVEERMAAGQITADEAKVHHYRHVLTRALGAEEMADPAVREIPFAPGDALVLCSDGLWGIVEDGEIAEAMARPAEAREAATALVDLAIERGGPDNISIAVIKVLPDDSPDGLTAEPAARPE
jgi:protein phosphatase